LKIDIIIINISKKPLRKKSFYKILKKILKYLKILETFHFTRIYDNPNKHKNYSNTIGNILNYKYIKVKSKLMN
jgi:hypothetical protein